MCAGGTGHPERLYGAVLCLRAKPRVLDGVALAYYQWESGLRFAEIEAAVSITEVCHLYTPYHEMDIRQFVDRMNELYQAAKQRQG